MPSPSLRTVARKLALSCSACAALLVALEVAARVAEPGPFELFDRSPYEPHEELHHVHKKSFRGAWDGSYYEINSRGWRGPEFEPRFAPEELRIVALGDSCTFGKAVEEEDTWPRRLESLLRAELKAPRTVIVANLGVNGYAGRDYLHSFVTQALETRPHVVAIAYNINDFPNVVRQVDAEVFHNQTNLRARIDYRWRERLSRLALYRWARAHYYDSNRERDFARMEQLAVEEGGEMQASPERMQLEEQRLGELVSAARNVGAHVVLFLVPYESQVHLETYSNGPVETVERLARTLEVEFVDVLGPFRTAARASDPPRRLFNRGDRYHPNAAGYDIIARTLAEFVVSRGWTAPN